VIGDKLVITDYHRSCGRLVAEALLPLLEKTERKLAITVAGESGAGKSETAATTAEELERRGYKTLILGQDDYFVLPPKSNATKRQTDIGWVGPGEVRLDLLDQHLEAAKTGTAQITKPLVHFEEDRIGEETISLEGFDAVIAEGTYTTLLDQADFRAFIDRTYRDTLEHRKKRARDEAEGEFIERVLEIEHRVIRDSMTRADLVLPPPDKDTA
jgi:uridine kinase